MLPELLANPPVLVPRQGVISGTGGGRIKEAPGDFRVEEIPAYEPSGEGQFLYLKVEKEDVSGPALVRFVAERLEIGRNDIGVAGLKDRRAVTQQWISVPADAPNPPEAIAGPVGETGRISLLETRIHVHKLRTGHLKGNRFEIRIRGRAPELDDGLRDRLASFETRGFPNTFGGQRFGRGDAVATGMAALEGRRVRDRRGLRFGISAVQSALFNGWLALRTERGLVDTVLEGDMMRRRETGGLFLSTEPDTDTERLAAGELVVTGPMFGSRPSRASGAARALEAEVLAQAGLEEASLKGLGRLARGARRPALAWPTMIAVERDDDAVSVAFTLKSGVYATVLLSLLCGEPLRVGLDAKEAGT